MKGMRGSYLGFTYNNIHSSTMNITRIFSSSRMDEKLVPTMKDRVVDGPTDGQYYFGTNYTKREFVVNFAYDGMTEETKRYMVLLWQDSTVHDLIFDEMPYKVYSAKITGQSTLKELCFVEGGRRIYRGEGSFVFTCFYPLARSRYQYIEDYNAMNIAEWIDDSEEIVLEKNAKIETQYRQSDAVVEYDLIYSEGATTAQREDGAILVIEYNEESDLFVNTNEWKTTSGLPSKEEYGNWEDDHMKIWNCGDVAMPMQIWFTVPGDGKIASISIKLETDVDGGDPPQTLHVQGLTAARGDNFIVVDLENYIIEGYVSEQQSSGNLYNSYIVDGDFFDVPLGASMLTINGMAPYDIKFHYLYY